MNIESVSDSVQGMDWNEGTNVVCWNGMDLTTIHRNDREDRISSIALQRVRFNSDRTGYILCRNENDAKSTSETKDTNDRSSKSEPESNQTEVRHQVSFGGMTNKENGYSSNEVHGKYRATIDFDNGNSLELSAKGSYERSSDHGDSRDKLSGEIDASYNF